MFSDPSHQASVMWLLFSDSAHPPGRDYHMWINLHFAGSTLQVYRLNVSERQRPHGDESKNGDAHGLSKVATSYVGHSPLSVSGREGVCLLSISE